MFGGDDLSKLNVVLVVLNEQYLERTLQTLNLNNANLVAIVVDGNKGKVFNVGKKEIPIISFAQIQSLLDRGKDFVWLINGYINGVGDIWRMKKFLMNGGVPEDNIVNFEILSHISLSWLANLRYIEKNGVDFFATGISYTEVGLDLRYIPHTSGRGVNLACSNQDLQQAYLTAKHIFEHVKPGTIKFVLIGLAPYDFRYTNAEAFSVCSRNLQYMLALNSASKNLHDELLKILVSDKVNQLINGTTEQKADLNLNGLKNFFNSELPAKAVINWEAELDNLTKKLRPQVIEQNLNILKAYINLCHENGAKPVGVVFPFPPIIRKNYDTELLTNFRAAIRQLKENHGFTCVDLFDLELGYDCFYNMAHLNLKGAAMASTLLGFRLHNEGIITTEKFCDMSYRYFNDLAWILSKKNYNVFLPKIFAQSAKLICDKNKIKIGFVLYDSALWCGDDLYNFFTDDPRFEPTIFLCHRIDKLNDELIRNDFEHGVEQFKSRGLNVIPIAAKDATIPKQDVLIFLTPYFEVLPNTFQLSNLSARTLLFYIPYGFNSTANGFIYNTPLYHICQKLFFDTQYHINLLERECRTGMSRGIYSGYPKMDIFFKDKANCKFEWKSARRNAKKIVWAPHWSINEGIRYATFQWNYRFMYEFAKAHPEISWVVKPHPNLLYSAVSTGLFPTAKAFLQYLKDWNALPNAQVVTGGYYQEIFATSDGMIHDCGSFIAEYQYTHKPMIYLRRDTQKFNDLGAAILNVSYLVDGQDLNGIAALMQKVFIEGNDPKFRERLKFFNEHLNYFAQNGMLASEFIFKNISDELNGQI